MTFNNKLLVYTICQTLASLVDFHLMFLLLIQAFKAEKYAERDQKHYTNFRSQNYESRNSLNQLTLPVTCAEIALPLAPHDTITVYTEFKLLLLLKFGFSSSTNNF